MALDDSSPATRRNPWSIVVGAGTTQAVSAQPLLLSTFSLFVLPLAQATGWSRPEVLGGFTACALGLALGLPIIGRLIDRLALRPILVTCWIAYCICVAAIAVTPLSLPLFYVPFFLIGLFTSGVLISCSKAIVTSFDVNRGAGIGISAAIMGLGTTTMPVIVTLLIRTAGFRHAYLWMALMALVIGLTFIILLVRPSAQPNQVASSLSGTRAPAPELAGLSVAEALRTSHFWLIVFALCLAALTVTGLQTNLVPIMLARGVSPDKATIVLSAFGLASLVGRLGGVLLDRFHGTRVGAALLLLAALGILLLRFNTGFITGVAGVALCGIAFGIEIDLLAFLTSRYFGMRRFGSLIGLLQGLVTLCIGIGPIVVGFAYERLGSYEAVLPLLGGTLVVCAIGILLLGPYTYPVAREHRRPTGAEDVEDADQLADAGRI